MRMAAALLAGTTALGGPPGPATLEAARGRVISKAAAAGQPFPLPQPEVRVFKARHTLELWAQGCRVATYDAALGHRGLADKVREGDHLTPEGRFTLCSRNDRSAFHLFLGISYPDAKAAERGFRSGLITAAQRARILRAARQGTCPPWDTPMGGTVGLHGGGTASDWTWGCIALADPHIEELWVACPVGTPVVIAP
ncbi:MAG: L,D-transpeptidase family protein [Acidobacteria bacterium]|nr:L,D-transpeptidase family protein [Acidobacteriota bacterium]